MNSTKDAEFKKISNEKAKTSELLSRQGFKSCSCIKSIYYSLKIIPLWNI